MGAHMNRELNRTFRLKSLRQSGQFIILQNGAMVVKEDGRVWNISKPL